MSSKIYLIDSNTLITANRSYYSFGLCPGFWEALNNGHSESRIKSLDTVKDEINKGKYDDKLKGWVKSMPDSFFCSTKEDKIIEQFGIVANWVNKQEQFYDYAKSEFMRDKVDGWLVAYAMAKLGNDNIVIVTHEKYEQNVKKNVKIPNLCKEFGVEYDDTFKMLNDLGVRFILEK